MRALVVYESMFGNTHRVAEAIGRGLRAAGQAAEVTVVPVERADAELVRGADLLVVGGPTHAHAMTRERTRQAAVEMARKPEAVLSLDPDAEGPGLRDWFDEMRVPGLALGAAFDTRGHAPGFLTGRASKGIARRLRKHGFSVVADPQSFFVTGKDTHLEPGEEERAEQWGRALAMNIAIRATA